MELVRVTEEQYEKLKKLGFPINTTSKNPTPTIAFILKWFRDEKHIRYGINWHWIRLDDFEEESFSFTLYSRNKDGGFEESNRYKTYEEAEASLINYLVDVLLEKKRYYEEQK